MPRPSRYVTRSQLGWSSTSPASYAEPRSGLVVHYDSANQGLAGKSHSSCLSYWKNTRAFHTGPSRGWDDIGYSFMACPHAYILEGRGLNRQQAAQPGGNATHYSVTLATGPDDEVTEDQINAVRALRQWLMQDHGVAGVVLGHRDFIATSCPGDKAYRMVRDGTFEQPPGAEGDLMSTLIGAKEGDQTQVVTAIQRLIVQAGKGSALGPAGVDGHWGPATSTALMEVRQSIGSSISTPIRVMNGETLGQLLTAMARRQVELYATCDCDGVHPDLPDEVPVSGTLKIEK